MPCNAKCSLPHILNWNYPHIYQTASIMAIFCTGNRMFQLWIVIVIGLLCCVHNNQVRLIICINKLIMEMHIRLPLFNHTYSWPEGTTNWRFRPPWSNINGPTSPHNHAKSIILHPTGVKRRIGLLLTQPIIILLLLYLIWQSKSVCKSFLVKCVTFCAKTEQRGWETEKESERNYKG